MASLLRPVRRAIISCSPSSSSSKTLFHRPLLEASAFLNSSSIPSPNRLFSHTPIARSHVGDMRKEAFKSNILRLLRNEIQYELDSSPPLKPRAEYKSFSVEEKPGEQWIRLTRKFKEKEEIKLEVTMFDGSVPAEKPTDGTPAVDGTHLHITFIVHITREGSDDVLDFICSAWPESVEIRNVVTHGRDEMPSQPYMGPDFKDLDDDLQNSLYEFLEERNIDDELAVFLHKYTVNKDKSEFLRWMDGVKTFIDKN